MKRLLLILLTLSALASFYFWYQGLTTKNTTPSGATYSRDKDVRIVPPLILEDVKAATQLTQLGVFLETNKQRVKALAPKLRLNEALNAAAEERARHMFNEGYFDHNTPEGDSFNLSIQMTGYQEIISAENIALGDFGNDKNLVQAWHDSPGHKKNLLFPRFQQIGIAVLDGVYKGRTTWISVQLFAVPQSYCPEINEGLRSDIEKEKGRLKNLLLDLEALKVDLENQDKNDAGVATTLESFHMQHKEYNQQNGLLNQQVDKMNFQIENHNNCVKELANEFR